MHPACESHYVMDHGYYCVLLVMELLMIIDCTCSDCNEDHIKREGSLSLDYLDGDLI